MTNFAEQLPRMLFGGELKTALTCLPEYDPSIRLADPGARLLRLADIYKVFLPGTMAVEIYHKLYMMTVLSLSQKSTIEAVRKSNDNHRWINSGEYYGVATGATSATIIGTSGVGKTSCVQKSVNLLGGIIESKMPYRKVVPVIIVSTPFDCNYKGLLMQILMAVDEKLDTGYYEKAQKSTVNAQQILGMVAQACHQFVGTLIIDEIQFIVQHKSGPLLYRMILQLINTSCNVLLVGTTECLSFFSQDQTAMQMARRSVGLQYREMEFGEEFRTLCETLWGYQYVRQEVPLTETLLSWLYEHTGGNPSTLVALIHDAQELAILEGRELLGLEVLTRAYNDRLQMLHGYIGSGIAKNPQAGNKRDKPVLPMGYVERAISESTNEVYISILDMIQTAKTEGLDILELLRAQVAVEEITV